MCCKHLVLVSHCFKNEFVVSYILHFYVVLYLIDSVLIYPILCSLLPQNLVA